MFCMGASGEVGVRELRQNLSVYLKRVKAGATLEVKERGRRVAVIVPVGARGSALDRLIAAGWATLRAGTCSSSGRQWDGDQLGAPAGL